jgi:hypothetical protein
MPRVALYSIIARRFKPRHLVGGPRPSDNPNSAYEPEATPLLKAPPEFWWMNEADRANAFEARALALGGSGYRHHQGSEPER